MEKITFCIPSRNNLRYLKMSLGSIRKNSYRNDHDIIVYVDRDEDGTVQWLKDSKSTIGAKWILNNTGVDKGIGYGYDACIAESETDVVVVYHADMYLGKNADLIAWSELVKYPRRIVSMTRIEPPLFPESPEKIVRNFGMYPEEFQESDFEDYVEYLSKTLNTKRTRGMFAPWMIDKKELISIGGHDSRFAPRECEDSDIFQRFLLNGMTPVQVWDGVVYHLASRGAGRFDDSEDVRERWSGINSNSILKFVQKWGSGVKNDSELCPIIGNRYRTTLYYDPNHMNDRFIDAITPFFDKVVGGNPPEVSDDVSVVMSSQYDTDNIQNNEVILNLQVILSTMEPKSTYVVGELTIYTNLLENKVSELIINENNDFFKNNHTNYTYGNQ